MLINTRTQEWLEWVVITSIPLRRLNSSDIPDGYASACLVHYRGRRFLLSVQHAVKRTSNDWVVELGYKPDKGTEIYRLKKFNYLPDGNIDFCYAEVPSDLISLYQYINPYGISDEQPRHLFQTDLTALPHHNQIFAFSGQVKTERHSAETFVTEMHVYPGLRYLQTENEFHVFELPIDHPGHEHFQGCSGAPIVDMNQNVVALVCKGDMDTKTIHGVSLAYCKFAFDLICNEQHAI